MSPNWKRLGAVFLLGAVVGVIGGSFIQRAMFRHRRAHLPQSEKIAKRLSGELGLDANQETQLKDLIDRYNADVSGLEKDATQKFDRLRMESRARIAKLLHPDQLEKFKKMTERWDHRRKTEIEFHR